MALRFDCNLNEVAVGDKRQDKLIHAHRNNKINIPKLIKRQNLKFKRLIVITVFGINSFFDK